MPNQEWAQDLEQSSGNPNDEIAVAAPIWMNIDSEDEPELLVSYGRSLWAFEDQVVLQRGLIQSGQMISSCRTELGPPLPSRM